MQHVSSISKQNYLLTAMAGLCPMRLICLERAPFGSWSTNSLHVDPFGGSSWCNMFPAIRNKTTCLQLWQDCAPWGSFVFERALFGSWSTNSLHVDPFGGSSWCNMSPASRNKNTCLQLWQDCAPWGSFVFERALSGLGFRFSSVGLLSGFFA